MKGSSVEILAVVWNCKHFLLILNEHLLEEGWNMWPKHATGYTVYSAINLHNSTCLFGRISHNFALKFEWKFCYDIIIIIIIILPLWIEKLYEN